MIDKIYEKIMEEEKKSAEYYYKSLDIMDENEVIEKTRPRKNIDLIEILSNTGLIEKNNENNETVEDYYEYLFKLGISLGIDRGKKLTIEAIQNNKIEFDKIMEVDCEEITSFDLKPTYVTDMIDNINNKI